MKCAPASAGGIIASAPKASRRLGATEIKVFLSHLAIAGKVLASIQNPAIERTAIFYRQLLKINELWLTDIVSMRQGKRLPGLLTTVR